MIGSTLQAIQSFEYWPEIGAGTVDTLIMTALSLMFTVLIGLPIGVALFLSSWTQRSERLLIARLQGWTYKTLSLAVNVLRSLPFLILLILLIPATRWLVGTSLGVAGSIPPLVIAAAPFFARLVENLLREVDRGVFEACRALGATTRQTVLWALLPETLTGLLAAITVTAPTRDALFIEGADSPYANLVAARPDNVNSPAILKLVAALRSPEAKKFVKDTYHGAVLTTF